MTKGSKYWAVSYVLLKNNEKVYVENPVSDIERQMKSGKKYIRLELSVWFDRETIYIKKKQIERFAEMY